MHIFQKTIHKAICSLATVSILFLASPTTGQTETNPNYATVFPQNKANRIDIVIKPSQWARLNTDMEKRFGKFGSRPMHDFPHPEGDSGKFGPGMPFPPNDSMMKRFPFPPNDSMRPMMNDHDGPMGMMPPPNFNDKGGNFGPRPISVENSIYVPCSFNFEGKEWKNVGIRFKGNASLMQSWTEGNKKLPLRIDFDKFKDSLPELANQNFFGFKELTFSNGVKDNSLMHEKIAADIFREAGVKSPQTAFYRVYVDYGDGPIYMGLYTAVEVVDDTMLKTQFGSGNGNCYKPDGQGATFAKGSFDEASFEKKTNKKLKDWSDVKKLEAALNSDTRLSNPVQWHSDLESALDVPAFLKWLAVNTTIQNWDTYGTMYHNFYLYNDPKINKLVWIPWDNNEALSEGGMGGGSSLALDKVKDNWPLIRYLLDDSSYVKIYRQEIKNLIEGAFEPEKMKKKYDYYHQLIAPYAIGKDGELKGSTCLNSPEEFERSLKQLKQHVDKRNKLAKEYLKSK